MLLFILLLIFVILTSMMQNSRFDTKDSLMGSFRDKIKVVPQPLHKISWLTPHTNLVFSIESHLNPNSNREIVNGVLYYINIFVRSSFRTWSLVDQELCYGLPVCGVNAFAQKQNKSHLGIFYLIIIIVIDFFWLCMCVRMLVCTRSHIAIITFNFSSLFYWFLLLFITIHSFASSFGCWCCTLINAWNTIHLFNSLRFSQSFSPAVHANISLISHFDPAISWWACARVCLCRKCINVFVLCPEKIFFRPCRVFSLSLSLPIAFRKIELETFPKSCSEKCVWAE